MKIENGAPSKREFEISVQNKKTLTYKRRLPRIGMALTGQNDRGRVDTKGCIVCQSVSTLSSRSPRTLSVMVLWYSTVLQSSTIVLLV